MGLVDLRGREHDERVAPLLALAAGHQAESAERTTQRSRPGEWTFIGWEVDGLVVACAGVSRSGDGDVELHSVAVAPGRRGNGFGRAIVDALAEVVNAPSISAAAGEDAVGFYRACGFSVEPAPEDGGGRLFRCTRPLAARVDPSPAVIVTLAGIDAAVRAAWSEQTADDPATWSSDNPARHHCDVTSLLVRELLGGEILIANVILDGRRVERHAWNRLPSGLEVDLTREQFRRGEELARPMPGEPIAIARVPERYALFARRVHDHLGLTAGAT